MKQRFFNREFGFCGDLEVVDPKLTVGVQLVADGGTPAIAPRQGKTSEAVVGQAHGKYYEATSRGNVYSATNATARSPQVSLTTTAPLVLYNPVGSGKRFKIMKVTFAQAATGTLGTGAQYHCGFCLNGPTATQSGVLPTGTAVTPKNMDLGNSNSSAATVLEQATLNAAPAALYPFANLSEAAGGTIAGNSDVITEDVDGGIVLEPGSGYTTQGIAAAGSSPLCWIGIVWEEIPIV